MKYSNLLIFLTIVSATMNLVVAQPVKKLSAPVKTKVKGFAEAYCIALDARSRVCKGNPNTEDAQGGEFVLERNGKEINRWEAEISSTTGAQNFDVLHSDLDGNGTRELIVVDFIGSGMGMGVNNHKIHIFGQDERQSPIEISVEEYGALGSFVAQTKGVLILATEWLYTDKIDPHLPSGLYLIGKWFRYANGLLEPVNKPILARRYLNSFARERGRTMLTNSIPKSWFANGKGRELNTDPGALNKIIAKSSGTIVAINIQKLKGDAADPESSTTNIPVYVVKLDSGAEMNFTSHPFTESEAKPEDIKSFDKFGLGKCKVVLPIGVDIEAFYRNLVGVRVEAISYQPNAEAEIVTILWVETK
jgi:hypothetical protein